MKRLALATVLSAGSLVISTGTVFAHGNGLTQASVEARGWICFPGDVMVHCVHPNIDVDALVAGTLASVPSLNFAPGGETFLGTEILLRADVGDDERPCRQGTEPDGTYEAVDFGGAPGPEYFSCHHNNDLP